MSAAARKSFEDQCTSTEDITELNKTNGEVVNMWTKSVYSNVSHATVKAGADSSFIDGIRHSKALEELQEGDTSKETVEADSVTELSAQPNDNSQDTRKSKQLTPEQNDSKADDFRKAYMIELASESFILTQSRHGSRLPVRAVVVERSAEMVGNIVIVVENEGSEDDTAARSSATSPKSRKTDRDEADGHAASVASLRPAKSQTVAAEKSSDITASVTSLRSDKRYRRTRNKTEKSKAGSGAMSLVSVGADKSDTSSVDHVTASENCLQAYGENVGSHPSVRRSANIKGSDGVESGNGRSSVTFLNSEVSPDASSVVLSKPPKHTAVIKAGNDGRAPAAVDAAVNGCTSGNSISFILHLL